MFKSDFPPKFVNLIYTILSLWSKNKKASTWTGLHPQLQQEPLDLLSIPRIWTHALQRQISEEEINPKDNWKLKEESLQIQDCLGKKRVYLGRVG